MTKKQCKLAATVVKIAADQFGNHGCNDIDKRWFEGWTDAEKQELCDEIRRWNGIQDPYPENVEQIGDDGLLSFVAHKLDEMGND